MAKTFPHSTSGDQKTSKLPAIQFYPGDWKKDIGVQSLSFHDRGVWFEMLLLMHDSEERGKLVLNGHPMDDEDIARVIGLDNQTFNQTLTNLLTKGVTEREAKSGALISRRMLRDENLRKVRQEAGKQGGNPVLLKQNSTTGVKQIPTPSSSSSITNTNTIADAGGLLDASPSSQDSSSPNPGTPVSQPTASDPAPAPPPVAPQPQKHQADPRTEPFKAALRAYWMSKNSLTMDWDASEGKKLKDFLAANPNLNVDDFERMLRNRSQSVGVNHGDRPRAVLSTIAKYAAAPIGEFNKPLLKLQPRRIQAVNQ